MNSTVTSPELSVIADSNPVSAIVDIAVHYADGKLSMYKDSAIDAVQTLLNKKDKTRSEEKRLEQALKEIDPNFYNDIVIVVPSRIQAGALANALYLAEGGWFASKRVKCITDFYPAKKRRAKVIIYCFYAEYKTFFDEITAQFSPLSKFYSIEHTTESTIVNADTVGRHLLSGLTFVEEDTAHALSVSQALVVQSRGSLNFLAGDKVYISDKTDGAWKSNISAQFTFEKLDGEEFHLRDYSHGECFKKGYRVKRLSIFQYKLLHSCCVCTDNLLWGTQNTPAYITTKKVVADVLSRRGYIVFLVSSVK